jgi:predicted nucleic acid-binding protein
MKNLFLDTNVIIDLIADRKPFSKYAIELFNAAENGHLQIYTSSHSVATTHYLLKKFIAEDKLREILYNLLDYLIVIPVDVQVLKIGLKSAHKDFEDAIQITCAIRQAEISGIVTRNKKDFRKSELPVLSPDEACALLEK